MLNKKEKISQVAFPSPTLLWTWSDMLQKRLVLYKAAWFRTSYKRTSMWSALCSFWIKTCCPKVGRAADVKNLVSAGSVN